MREKEGKASGWRGRMCAPGGVGKANDHDSAPDEPQGQSWARVCGVSRRERAAPEVTPPPCLALFARWL